MKFLKSFEHILTTKYHSYYMRFKVGDYVIRKDVNQRFYPEEILYIYDIDPQDTELTYRMRDIRISEKDFNPKYDIHFSNGKDIRLATDEELYVVKYNL